MHDQRVGLGSREFFISEAEQVEVFAHGRYEAALHALGLQAQHHHDVGIGEPAFHIAADLDAIAVDLTGLAKGDINLIDSFNGLADLKSGVIRAVTEASLESDAVRLLRSVRLASELGFKIEAKTEALIKKSSRLIADISGERIREELLRLLAAPGAANSLSYLDDLGLLTAIIPELKRARKVKQPAEHHWDVFDHSIKTVAAAEFVLHEGKWEYAEEALKYIPWSETITRHFNEEVSHGSSRRSLLKLSALLHDIAKPQTKAITEDGRMRFLGHAKDGADATADILERLRFSGKEIKLVETEVEFHLRPTQMSQEGMPSRRAIYRYFRDSGKAGIDTLYLSLADHLATRGPDLEIDSWQEHAKVVDYVLTQHFQQESSVAPAKLVSGHDLIEIFGLSPGPKVGEILEAVREAQASGELANRESALRYIRQAFNLSSVNRHA